MKNMEKKTYHNKADFWVNIQNATHHDYYAHWRQSKEGIMIYISELFSKQEQLSYYELKIQSFVRSNHFITIHIKD